MGTPSKRGIEEFGDDVKQHIDELKSRVGKKLDEASASQGSAQADEPMAVGGSLGETGSNFGRALEEAAETSGDARPELAAGGAQLVDESGTAVGSAKASAKPAPQLVDERGAPVAHAKTASAAPVPRGRIPVSDETDLRSIIERSERPSATEPMRAPTSMGAPTRTPRGTESRAIGPRRFARGGAGDDAERDTRDLRGGDETERNSRPIGTRGRNARGGEADDSGEWSPYSASNDSKERGKRRTSSARSRARESFEGLEGEAVTVGDRVAHQIERVMAGVPTATWLTLSGATLVGSFVLRLLGRRATANLMSGWAPMFLVCGLYNKLTTVGAATALLSSRS